MVTGQDDNSGQQAEAALAGGCQSRDGAADHGGAQAPAEADDWTGPGSDERLSALLHRVMGFGEFRGRQLEVFRRVLAGRSTLAVLPTGEASVRKLDISCKSQRMWIRCLMNSHVCPTAKEIKSMRMHRCDLGASNMHWSWSKR